MKRLLLVVAALFTLVALAGAVGLPDLAGAQDAPEGDTITVTGVGSVEVVPNEAQMSFGVETRAATAKAAVAANADAMRKIINALRQARGREIATQWVSVYPVTNDTGAVDGYSASNSVSATADVDDAADADRRGCRGRRESDLRARPELEQRGGALPAGARQGGRRGTRTRRGARQGCRPVAGGDQGHLRADVGDAVLRRAHAGCRCGLDADRSRRAGDERQHQRHVRLR